MLHGRVVRPPYAGVDAGPFVGTSLIAVDEASVRRYSRIGRGGEDRRFRRRRGRARRKRGQGRGPTQGDLEADADSARPARRRNRAARQSIDAANADRQGRRRCRDRRAPPSRCTGLTSGPTRCTARSARPARSRTIGDGRIRVWSGTQNPHVLRTDLALLLGSAGGRDRCHPDGSGRLLRPQLRRRRLRRCAAAVARGRPSGSGAIDPRAGARLGAQRHRAIDGRQRRAERRRQRRRL